MTGGSYFPLLLLDVTGFFLLQLFFWNTDNWEKIKSVALQLPAGKAPQGDTRVQFLSDQVRFLVCHETQLAIYDANKMECVRQVRCYTLCNEFKYAVNKFLTFFLYCSGYHKKYFLHLYLVQPAPAIAN